MALMGSAMARILFDLDSPTVGLLNIGVEEVKGLEEVRAAGQILRERKLPHRLRVGWNGEALTLLFGIRTHPGCTRLEIIDSDRLTVEQHFEQPATER